MTDEPGRNGGERREGPPASLDCGAVVRQLWDYLDRRLGPEDAAVIDAHLAACALCPPHFAFERAFLDAVARARAEARDVTTLRDRVLTALHARGFVAP